MYVWTFYEQELQKSKHAVFMVEEMIKKKVDKLNVVIKTKWRLW